MYPSRVNRLRCAQTSPTADVAETEWSPIAERDDIWVATPGANLLSTTAATVSRFATLTDCGAEPTGIYFDMSSNRLFVNVQHRGGDRLDKTMAVFATKTR
jgi:secreted PhoX family phosphatase